MLRLWRNQIGIAIFPDEIRITRAGSLFGKTTNNLVENIIIDGDSVANNELDTLERLQAYLLRAEIKNADATVVLSNQFVRYAVLPWSDQLTTQDEEDSFAQIQFEKIYGEEAKLWAIRVSDGPYGASRVASAIDQLFFERLKDILAKSHLRLVSLQPLLMNAFNHWRRHLERAEGLLIFFEPKRMIVCRINAGGWQEVRGIPLCSADKSIIEKLAEREILMSGLGADTTVFWGSIGVTTPALEMDSINVIHLPTPPAIPSLPRPFIRRMPQIGATS